MYINIVNLRKNLYVTRETAVSPVMNVKSILLFVNAWWQSLKEPKHIAHKKHLNKLILSTFETSSYSLKCSTVMTDRQIYIVETWTTRCETYEWKLFKMTLSLKEESSSGTGACTWTCYYCFVQLGVTWTGLNETTRRLSLLFLL